MCSLQMVQYNTNVSAPMSQKIHQQKSICINSNIDTTEEKRDIQSCPERYYEFCLSLEKQHAAGFPGLWKGTTSQTKFTSLALAFMKSKIKDPELLKSLLPAFEAGCRRFTPGGHYLDALQKSNATFVQDSIRKLRKNSLVTESGDNYECDVLVYATGFEP